MNTGVTQSNLLTNISGKVHLELCYADWSPHYVKDTAVIKKVQKRLTRMVPHLKHYHTREISQTKALVT